MAKFPKRITKDLKKVMIYSNFIKAIFNMYDADEMGVSGAFINRQMAEFMAKCSNRYKVDYWVVRREADVIWSVAMKEYNTTGIEACSFILSMYSEVIREFKTYLAVSEKLMDNFGAECSGDFLEAEMKSYEVADSIKANIKRIMEDEV